jgi:hypothetical protein
MGSLLRDEGIGNGGPGDDDAQRRPRDLWLGSDGRSGDD